jgi:hypothetical protein
LSIRPELKNILVIIGNLAHHDTVMTVLDSTISMKTSIPDHELGKILNELDSLGLIKILPKAPGVDFWLIQLTAKGLEALQGKY